MAQEARLDPQVVAAAGRAFARFGYRGATLERIAAEAGLSRVTLHRRGVRKEHLLAALAEEGTRAYREAIWPALTAPGDARERLAAALDALCAAAEEQMPLLLALRAQSDEIFHESSEEPLTRSVFTEPLERLLRDGAADGSLRELDAEEYATVLFNLVGWTYIHLRTGHHWPSHRASEAVIDIALRGIAQP